MENNAKRVILKVIPDYIDKTDAEAAANEQRGKTLIINSQLKICKNGMVYTLTPVHRRGVSQAEIDQAVDAGEISFRHGMMVVDSPKPWENRNGEL